MTKTVVAMYDNFDQASNSVRALVDLGFSRSDISIMASDESGEYSQLLDTDRDAVGEATSSASEGAGVGAGIGAVLGGLGGLLVGLGALTIPGIGPVIAAGPLSAALTGLAGAGVGAVAGGVTGGLLGALVDMGVPEETAGYYAEGVRRGGTLVTVRTDDAMAGQVVDILNSFNPIDINDRVSQWRQSGWTGYRRDEPYATDETEWSRDSYRAEGTGVGAGATTDVQTAGDVGLAGAMDTSSDSSMGRDTSMSSTGGRTTGATYDTGLQSGTYSGDELRRDYQEFSVYETRFRQHYDNSFGASGYTYDQYMPAYRYGYDLATDERYRDARWNEVENDARRYWDERNPGTWERFKGAVRQAWEEVKGIGD